VKTIELSDEVFKLLADKAVGFDTPEMVIKRLLCDIDERLNNKLEIIFNPRDENEFKKEFIKSKKAKIIIYKSDGSQEIFIWNIKRDFNENSNLKGNLRSGYLRKWKDKKIIKAELFIII
jgi:hypothetical protein